MKQIFLFLVIAFSCAAEYSSAQVFQEPIPAYDSFTIQSARVAELRKINVWTPPGYETGRDSFPVLYMPDGGINEDFVHVSGTLSTLIILKKIPPVILVGIPNTERRRDLTGPTSVEKDKEIAPVVGGSASFRAFINDELFAEINKRYRTTPQKGIIGESLAGLFVTETLLLKPEMFDFYIAFDPSLWWNNKQLVKSAGDLLNKFPAAPRTFWFAGSSAKDIYKPAGKLADILVAKNIPGLIWRYSPEPQEQHNTIFRSTEAKAITWTLNNLAN